MFEQIKSKDISLDKLWKDLGFDQTVSEEEKRWREILREILEVCLLPEANFSKLDKESHVKKYANHIRFNNNIRERDSILPYHCKQIESFKFLQEEI